MNGTWGSQAAMTAGAAVRTSTPAATTHTLAASNHRERQKLSGPGAPRRASAVPPKKSSCQDSGLKYQRRPSGQSARLAPGISSGTVYRAAETSSARAGLRFSSHSQQGRAKRKRMYRRSTSKA